MYAVVWILARLRKNQGGAEEKPGQGWGKTRVELGKNQGRAEEKPERGFFGIGMYRDHLLSEVWTHEKFNRE